MQIVVFCRLLLTGWRSIGRAWCGPAAFVRSALECPAGAAVVDLPGEQATTEEFARAIESVVPESKGRIHVDGPSIPSNIPPQPNYISNLFADWRATPLVEGVRKTVDYYRQRAAP